LIGLDRGEHGAEPLVGHDVALCDPALFFEDGERQRAAVVSKLDAAIEVFVDAATSPRSSSVSGLGSIK
jgi:hypothetical protein